MARLAERSSLSEQSQDAPLHAGGAWSRGANQKHTIAMIQLTGRRTTRARRIDNGISIQPSQGPKEPRQVARDVVRVLSVVGARAIRRVPRTRTLQEGWWARAA